MSILLILTKNIFKTDMDVKCVIVKSEIRMIIYVRLKDVFELNVFRRSIDQTIKINWQQV